MSIICPSSSFTKLVRQRLTLSAPLPKKFVTPFPVGRHPTQRHTPVRPLRGPIVAAVGPAPDQSGPQPSVNPADSAPPRGDNQPWWQKFKKPLAFCAGAIALCIALTTIMAPPAFAAGSPISTVDWVGERMLYYMGKISTLSVAAKVVLVLSSTIPFIFIFGLLYTWLTSTHLHQSFIKMYALLNRLPGAAVLNEKTLPAAVLVNAVFFIGLFVFAVMLGVVTDEIKSTFKSIRNGRYPVNQAGHLVVLNWSPQAVPLLRQIAKARAAGMGGAVSQPVAVLSETPKGEMDAEILKRLKGVDIEVYTRSGSPSVPADLASVAAGQAASVIVLNAPTRDTSGGPAEGAATAHTAVALATLSPATLAHQNVVFQSPLQSSQMDQGGRDALSAFTRLTACGSRIQVLRFSDDGFIRRFTTLSSLQPGLSRVAMGLLGPSQASLRLQPVPPQYQGKTYMEVRRAYEDGVVVGYVRGRAADGDAGAGKKDADPSVGVGASTGGIMPQLVAAPPRKSDPVLSPSDKDVLHAGDEVVVLCGHKGASPSAAAPAMHESAAARATARQEVTSSSYRPSPCRVVVICMDSSILSELVADYAEFAPRGSSVTFVLPRQPPKDVSPSSKGRCSFHYIVDELHSSSVLRDAIKDATSVVVTGNDRLSAADADAFVMSCLLQVQDAVIEAQRTDAPHFVARIRKSTSQTSIVAYLNLLKQESALMRGAGPRAIITRPDLLIAEDVVAGVLAQSVCESHYAQLVRQLLCSEGAELYFRNPSVFSLPLGEKLTFAEINESVRPFGETAIGIIRADGSFQLAPGAAAPLSLQPEDKIIVFAEEYDVTKIKRS